MTTFIPIMMTICMVGNEEEAMALAATEACEAHLHLLRRAGLWLRMRCELARAACGGGHKLIVA